MEAKPPERVLKKMAAKPPELAAQPPEPLFNKCRPSLMGWGGMGWGGMKDQMGPSNIFILCGYIVYVYMNMYTYSKFVTNFVMGLKI